MTIKSISSSVAALILVACLASTASAGQVLGLFTGNGGMTGGPAFPIASSGDNMASGTFGGYGQSAPATPVSTIITNGSPADAGLVYSGTTFNRSITINPPLTSTANNSTGVVFALSTAGMNAGQQSVELSWSQTIGYRSSRYWQILVSKTGTAGTFSVPSGGTGSVVSQLINGMTSGSAALSGTANVTVSSSGLIDFRTLNNLSLAPAAITSTVTPANYASGFVDSITFTLPTGQGYENNANFAFAIVGAYDPTLSPAATSGTTGYVSSFAGSNSTDGTNGYNRSLASGGSMRLDLVTVSAVPEPSALVLAGIGAAAGCWTILRRRRTAPGA